MAGRRVEGTTVRLRRAGRHDLPALRRLLGLEAGARSERFDRRVLRHLSGTVSVLEDAGGALVGAVALATVRSFRAGHWCAHLDGLWVVPDRGDLIEPVVEAVVAMAAARGCQGLAASAPIAAPVAAALARRGAIARETWHLPIVPAPVAPSGPRRRRRP